MTGADSIITQQGGLIVIFDGAQVLPRPFLDISSLVLNSGERGLLSVVFHPNFTGFSSSTISTSMATRWSRAIASQQSKRQANARSEKVILRVVQPFVNHNGGQLQFGPDGFLYIGMGDGGGAGDPGNRAKIWAFSWGKCCVST